MTIHQITPRIPKNKAARTERGWQALSDRLPIFLAETLPTFAVGAGATLAVLMASEVIVARWFS